MTEFPWDEEAVEPEAKPEAEPEAMLEMKPETKPEPEAEPASEAAPADAGGPDTGRKAGDEGSADDVAYDSEPVVPRRSEAGTRPLVRKEYYAISEVADLVGLPAHVLRYWESQFAVLNPSKNRSGNRVYQRKEIRLILLVKQLLYDEKYTVEGAKQKLDQLRRGGGLQDATGGALNEQLVQVLRDELSAVAELLAPDAG